jgi:ASC-1-like (ASCH) protein
MREKSVLHMTLKREWFDKIAAGTKKEEYREQKPYWERRLMGRSYDEIIFRNGYGTHVPEMRVEFLGVTRRGTGKSAVFVIRLGRVLEKKRFGNR